MTRVRHTEVAPYRRRIEAPYTPRDDSKLTTIEGGRTVVYRGRTAMLDWLKRVAELARERSG